MNEDEHSKSQLQSVENSSNTLQDEEEWNISLQEVQGTTVCSQFAEGSYTSEQEYEGGYKLQSSFSPQSEGEENETSDDQELEIRPSTDGTQGKNWIQLSAEEAKNCLKIQEFLSEDVEEEEVENKKECLTSTGKILQCNYSSSFTEGGNEVVGQFTNSQNISSTNYLVGLCSASTSHEGNVAETMSDTSSSVGDSASLISLEESTSRVAYSVNKKELTGYEEDVQSPSTFQKGYINTDDQKSHGTSLCVAPEREENQSPVDDDMVSKKEVLQSDAEDSDSVNSDESSYSAHLSDLLHSALIQKQVKPIMSDTSASGDKDGEMLLGSIISVDDMCGVIAFKMKNRFECAIFDKTKVSHNNLKLSPGLSLCSVVHVGMQVSLRLSKTEENGQYLADVVEIDMSRDNIFSSSGKGEIEDYSLKNFYYGVIQNLKEKMGVISFYINGKKSEALFFRKDVQFNGMKIVQKHSLLSYLHEGMPVALQASRCSCHNAYKHQAPVVTVYTNENEIGMNNLLTEPRMIHNTVNYGTINTLDGVCGTVIFFVNGKEEKAIFFQNNVFVYNAKVEICEPLENIFEIGMPVSFLAKYFQLNYASDCRYIASTLNFQDLSKNVKTKRWIECNVNLNKEMHEVVQSPSVMPKLCDPSPTQIEAKGNKTNAQKQRNNKNLVAQTSNRVFYGIVQRLGINNGLISFYVNNKEEKAIFFKKCVLVNSMQMKSKLPLSSFLEVGMSVQLKVEPRIRAEYSYKAVCVNVQRESGKDGTLQCVPNKKQFNISHMHLQGVIESLHCDWGVIEFEMNNSPQKAIFYTSSVTYKNSHLDKDALRLGMHVTFKAKECEEGEYNFQAFSVSVPVQRNDRVKFNGVHSPKDISLEKSLFYGSVTELAENCGKIEFFKNGIYSCASFHMSDIHIDGKKLDFETSSFKDTLEIGTPVTLKIKCGNDPENFHATYINVNKLSPTKDVPFHGTRKHLDKHGGIVVRCEKEKLQTGSLEDVCVDAPVSLTADYVEGDKKLEGTSLQMKKCHLAYQKCKVEQNKNYIECKGRLTHVFDNYGIITFKRDNEELKAFFHKKEFFKSKQVTPSLKHVLCTDMLVAFTVENKQVNDDTYVAQNVKICGGGSVNGDLTTHIKDFVEDNTRQSSEQSMLDFHFEENAILLGYINTVAKKGGSITFDNDGKLKKIKFKKNDIQIDSSCPSDDLALLQVGMPVLFTLKKSRSQGKNIAVIVKLITESNATQYNECKYTGTVTFLNANGGNVTFIKEGTKVKAKFYRNELLVNGTCIAKLVSLGNIFKVGDKVKLDEIIPFKCKDKTVKYKVCDLYLCEKASNDQPTNIRMSLNESLSSDGSTYDEIPDCVSKLRNARVSDTQHIACGLGTVIEILSSTTAHLCFMLEGKQHVASFDISMLYINGHQCDATKTIWYYLSPGDYCFFNGTAKCGTPSYDLTCVWKDKEPALSSIFKSVIPASSVREYLSPDVPFYRGYVLQLAPPKAAMIIVETSLPVLLFVSSLRVGKGKLLTANDWIQDYLHVRDDVIVKVSARMYLKFHLAQWAWVIETVQNNQAKLASTMELSDESGSPSYASEREITIEEGDSSEQLPKSVASAYLAPISKGRGKVKGFLTPNCVIVESSVNGIQMEATFTKDMVKGSVEAASLQELFPVGKSVCFSGEIRDGHGSPVLVITSVTVNPTERNTVVEGKEYIATVTEIVRCSTAYAVIHEGGASYTVMILNGNFRPVPGGNFAVSKPISDFLKVNDRVCVIVRVLHGKKKKCSCFAIDSWKLPESCSLPVYQAMVMDVLETFGFMEDDVLNRTLVFRNCDAFLFGVSLEGVDLCQVLFPGQVVNYSETIEPQSIRVWYGGTVFANFTQQRNDIVSYCKEKYIDEEVLSVLIGRNSEDCKGYCDELTDDETGNVAAKVTHEKKVSDVLPPQKVEGNYLLSNISSVEKKLFQYVESSYPILANGFKDILYDLSHEQIVANVEKVIENSIREFLLSGALKEALDFVQIANPQPSISSIESDHRMTDVASDIRGELMDNEDDGFLELRDISMKDAKERNVTTHKNMSSQTTSTGKVLFTNVIPDF